MNERQRELLRILLINAKKIFRLEDLQGRLNCSEKTIRNDLNRLENFLEPYQETTLIRKPGTGICLQTSERAQAKIFQDIYQVSVKTKEERMIEIAYRLLIHSKPITLKELAKKYFTNAAEIKRDLDKITKWLWKFKLQVITKQHIGSVVEGEELDKRNALAHLSELVSNHQQRNYVLDFFPKNEMNAVKKGIRDTQMAYQLDLTDGGFESLLIHALIMIKRIRQGTPVRVSGQKTENIVTPQEYQITSYLLNHLETTLHLKIPENERIYYSWHFSSSIRNKHEFATTVEKRFIDQLAEQMVKELITKVQYLTDIHFDQDSMLKEGLLIHMDSVVKRLTYGFHMTNPMLQDIKKLYPYLFSMVVLALNHIEATKKLHVPEEEAAYLTLYFQTSIEQIEKRQTPQRVLVVCHLGIGMSRLLQAKLEQQYKGLIIIGCIAKHELTSYLKKETTVDFIITTVPLPALETPHIVISPLLDTNDKTKLNQFIQEDKQEFTSTSYPMLRRLLKKGFFQKNIDLAHPYEVVERLANQLVRLNRVDESFTHQAVLRERASFTSIGGKIAIPHAEPATVKISTLSVAILKRPIEWGNEMVSIVFLLAVNEEDRQMMSNLLKEIANLSQTPPLIEKIIHAHTKENLVDLLDISSVE